MAVQIQARRGDSTLWTSSNPVLAEGELGVELDTHRWKVGDGTTAWNSLGYATDLELLPIIGSRTYTEQNYVTNGETVTESLDAIDTTVASHLADNAISPENYLGNSKEKIQSAIADAITQNKAVRFNKIYDITGLGPITITKPETDRTSLYLIGEGGGIKKTDLGYMFQSSLTDHGDIVSNKMKYIGLEGCGLKVWNCNTLIRLNSIADAYVDVDQIFNADNRWMQSIRLINCLVAGGSGWAISARYTFDCTIKDNLVEHREHFMRNTYDFNDAFQFDNMNLRIKDNCIEGLTGKAFFLGACYGSKISSNYLELNTGGYIDLSANVNVVTHAGLEVSNNLIDLSAEQVAQGIPAIKWGFIHVNQVSKGNSTNGLLHSVTINGAGQVVSEGDYSGQGTLIDTSDRGIFIGIGQIDVATGSIYQFGTIKMIKSTDIETPSIPVDDDVIVNIPLPVPVQMPFVINFNATPQWAYNTHQIVNYNLAEDLLSVNVRIKNLHTLASTFTITAIIEMIK